MDKYKIYKVVMVLSFTLCVLSLTELFSQAIVPAGGAIPGGGRVTWAQKDILEKFWLGFSVVMALIGAVSLVKMKRLKNAAN